MANNQDQPTTAATTRIPESLSRRLNDFRLRVWWRKLTEAAAIAVLGVAFAFLAVFGLDRFADTPPVVRAGLVGVAAAACGVVPWFLYRWVWSRRTPKQLARLLSRRLPRVGDQLLGVIELAENRDEQSRSRTLVAAAIHQAAEDASRVDFLAAGPPSRRRLWGATASAGVAAVVAIMAFLPDAASNAWRRLAAPWGGEERYTFTRIEPPPNELVIAHGEPFSFPVELQDRSEWRPRRAVARIGRRTRVEAPLAEAAYRLEMPPQIEPGDLRLSVGDARHRVRVEPEFRPELVGVTALVRLPEHLRRPEPLRIDARSGSLSVTRGSRVSFAATASRPLASAAVDGQAAVVRGSALQTPEALIVGAKTRELAWVDEHGLSGGQAFSLSISATEDEKPRIVIESMPAQTVALESELMAFSVRASDDFGVRRVGYEWRGTPRPGGAEARGERVLAEGGPRSERLAADGAFSARSVGVAPQPIDLRAFVEDYCPGNGRVYSEPHRVIVLSPDEHAVWVTEQLDAWRRQTQETHDREQRLHEQNRVLQALPLAELESPKGRRRIARQAAAELANSRRLQQTNGVGAELVRAAARNPEIDAPSLERWSGVLRVLNRVSRERMPKVAAGLQASSKASAAAAALPGGGGGGDGGPGPSRGGLLAEQLGLAVSDQEQLLAEFNKAADQLDEVVAGFRSGTIVKRFRLAAARQQGLARSAARRLAGAFGRRGEQAPPEPREAFRGLAEDQRESTRSVSLVADDLRALYFRERRQPMKQVLDEIQGLDLLDGLRRIEQDLANKPGLAIAQSEFWADTLDRWADDLIETGQVSQFESGGTAAGLPPALVREAMLIVEAEVNLREETRVAEQARHAIAEREHGAEAARLSQAQEGLKGRVVALAKEIRGLQASKDDFEQELDMLASAEQAMKSARSLLSRGKTGARAIAAETQVIEIMLKSQRINPSNKRGGAGSTAGGAGFGDTNTPALALIGEGIDREAKRPARVVRQSTGGAGEAPPAEFRAGLDEYFSRLEQSDRGF